jgi:hypothetical protein
MLYEIFWVFYALGIAILISIGFLGILFSLSIPSARKKVMGMGLSIAIILAALCSSYQWNVKKEGIRTFTEQAEDTIKQYLAKHKR